MNPTIDIGFISIHWYSIFILIAILVASHLILKESQKFGFDEDFMMNLIFFAVVIGIIGARIYYVLFHLDYYLENPIEIVMFWKGGLAIHGGIISALIFIIIYLHIKKKNTLLVLDFIVVGLIIGQAIGRWGNFFNGEAHGPATTLSYLHDLFIPDFIINGMYINGTYYIPTFFFESLWCILGFIILFFFRNWKNNKIGFVTSLYLIWYSIGRFWIESFRTDSLMFFDFKIAQIVSLLMIISGIVLFIISYKKGKSYKLEMVK